MKLQDAKIILWQVADSLREHCDNLLVAGSVRRNKPEVGDIEIVCLPKNTELTDMFGWNEGTIRDLKFSKAVIGLGKVVKGSPEGRYCQIQLKDIVLDLFMPERYDFWRQYAIRTGSADYSFKVIASAWRAKGWVGTPDGLRLMSECVESKLPDGKSKWTISVQNPKLPPVWKSEEEFFEWIGVKWIKPELRNV